MVVVPGNLREPVDVGCCRGCKHIGNVVLTLGKNADGEMRTRPEHVEARQCARRTDQQQWWVQGHGCVGIGGKPNRIAALVTRRDHGDACHERPERGAQLATVELSHVNLPREPAARGTIRGRSDTGQTYVQTNHSSRRAAVTCFSIACLIAYSMSRLAPQR